MRWNVTVPPAAEPVSLKAAKLYLRVDHALDDSVIEMMIAAWRQRMESILGRCLILQEMTVWGTFPMTLPRSPVQDIVEVMVEKRPLTPDLYTIEHPSEGARLVLSSKKGKNIEGKVRYKAGYGDTPEKVPDALRLALLVMVQRSYHMRAGVEGGLNVSMDDVYQDLLASFRRGEI